MVGFQGTFRADFERFWAISSNFKALLRTRRILRIEHLLGFAHRHALDTSERRKEVWP